jgi:thiamine-monophosphate kinase
VLGGGEDHGLLATFAPGTAPPGFTVVGRTLARQTGRPSVLLAGADPVQDRGFDHFKR